MQSVVVRQCVGFEIVLPDEVGSKVALIDSITFYLLCNAFHFHFYFYYILSKLCLLYFTNPGLIQFPPRRPISRLSTENPVNIPLTLKEMYGIPPSLGVVNPGTTQSILGCMYYLFTKWEGKIYIPFRIVSPLALSTNFFLLVSQVGIGLLADLTMFDELTGISPQTLVIEGPPLTNSSENVYLSLENSLDVQRYLVSFFK